MKKIVALLTILVICFSNAFANNDPANKDFLAVEKQLTSNTGIAGKFTQTRAIQGLETPLKSSGTFSLSEDGNLTWTQTKPFKSVITMSKTRLVQTIMNNPPTVMTKEEQPIVFTFTQVFMSILKGNTQSAKEYFDVNFTGTTKAWQISFIPKGSPLNKAIKNITLEGSKTINTIKVIDSQGNIIDIKFSDIKMTPSSSV